MDIMKIKNYVKKLSTRELADTIKALKNNKVATVYLPGAWIARELVYFAEKELIKRGF